MTEHLQDHIERFASAFHTMSDALEKAMTSPSVETGYRLYRAHQAAAMEYVRFMNCFSAEHETEEPVEHEKKEMVN